MRDSRALVCMAPDAPARGRRFVGRRRDSLSPAGRFPRTHDPHPLGGAQSAARPMPWRHAVRLAHEAARRLIRHAFADARRRGRCRARLDPPARRAGPMLASRSRCSLTLPLLFRHRFPFAAPALVFVGVAGVSLVSRAASRRGRDSRSRPRPRLLGRRRAARGPAGARRLGARARRGHRARPELARRAMQVADAEVDIGSPGSRRVGLPLGAFALRRREAPAALEGRAERLARGREERARAAVAAERARIARDLHDVIAHSVSVMTVQGGAARLLLEQDARRARESLLAVEETGHQAMAEMRRLLGLVHAEDDGPRWRLSPACGRDARPHAQAASPGRDRGRARGHPASSRPGSAGAGRERRRQRRHVAVDAAAAPAASVSVRRAGLRLRGADPRRRSSIRRLRRRDDGFAAVLLTFWVAGAHNERRRRSP